MKKSILEEASRGHKESHSIYETLEFIMELPEHKKPQTVSEQLIKTLHRMVVRDIEKEWAGRYRNSKVMITGAGHRPPEASSVPSAMAGLIQWFRDNEGKLHAIELAAISQHKFVNIHPFFDGNGRVSRLLMNVILLRAGYPLSIVQKTTGKSITALFQKQMKAIISLLSE
jgi:Fic family protein